MIEINRDLTITDDDLSFEYARSSGPGGQNVNKVETKVTLRFDLDGSRSLSEAQKAKIRERLGSRITRDGVLRVVSQRHRSRGANQKAAVERFAKLVAEALEEEKPRVKTKVPKGLRRRRLENKRRRAEVKKLRSKRDFD